MNFKIAFNPADFIVEPIDTLNKAVEVMIAEFKKPETMGLL